jgi:gluconokinase
VTGSGKSTLGRALAGVTGWPFADGDDFHSAANKEKMHAGIPLTDEDRAPWLEAVHARLLAWERAGESGILACSALRAAYREVLRRGIAEIRFLLLTAPRSVLEARLRERRGHFMNPALLDSQLATLETGPDMTPIDVSGSREETLAAVRRQLGV